ncbi:MAG: hypothetical protein V4702_05855 [Patescibacteria group bacterium]
MHKKESGFSAIEGLLIIIILGMLGLVSWYVYRSTHATKSTSNTSVTDAPSQTNLPSAPKYETKTFTDSSGNYSVAYPATWAIAELPEQSAGFAPPVDEIKGIRIVPPDASTLNINSPLGLMNKNGVSVSALKGSLQDLKQRLTNAELGVSPDTEPYPSQDLTINGYSASFYQIEKAGYADQFYLINHGGITVKVDFRLKQAAGLAGVTEFDESKNIPYFQEIAKSIKFLK